MTALKPGYYWLKRGLGSMVAQPPEVEGPAYHPDDVTDLLGAAEALEASLRHEPEATRRRLADERTVLRAAIARVKGGAE